MIENVVADFAGKMGIRLKGITLEEIADCRDAFMLKISNGNNHVYTLIFQTDLDNFKAGNRSTNMFLKINSALTRLNTR
jgi:hypothetical protein